MHARHFCIFSDSVCPKSTLVHRSQIESSNASGKFQSQYAVFLMLNYHNIWHTSYRHDCPRLRSRAAAMTKRKRTREKKRKAQSQEQLVTPDQMSIARWFAGTYDKAWLLIEHPHSYREWNIVGRCDVPWVLLLGITIPLKPWRAAGDLHGLRALSSREPI